MSVTSIQPPSLAEPSPEQSGSGPVGLRGWIVDSFALDIRSLALFRICLALVVLTDLGIRAVDLTTFYTDAGIVPRSRLEARGWESIHAIGGSARFESALFGIHALFAFAMLVGYRTRLATFMTCFMLHSLILRNPHVLQGGDGLLRVLLFWAIFLPLGACWSVDSLRSSYAPSRRALSVATAALILQMCFLYIFSAVLKSDPAWRSEGTAVYYALNIDQLVKPTGLALLHYPDLMRVMTHATFWLEAVGPLLLFTPFLRWQIRLATVIAFLLFHLVGLNLCMELGPFPYVCAAGWLAILPTAFWDRVAGWWGRRPRLGDGVIALPLWLNVLTAGFLIYVFLWNLRAANPARFEHVLPQSANPVGFGLGLDQYWAMFSPHPPHDDGWYVCHATLRNGEEVDLLRDGRPLDWSKPPLVSALYPRERWRKFMMNLPRPGQSDNRAYLLDHLWDRWDASQPPERQLQKVELYYILEMTPPPDHTGPIPTEPLLLAWRKLTPATAIRYPVGRAVLP